MLFEDQLFKYPPKKSKINENDVIISKKDLISEKHKNERAISVQDQVVSFSLFDLSVWT